MRLDALNSGLTLGTFMQDLIRTDFPVSDTKLLVQQLRTAAQRTAILPPKPTRRVMAIPRWEGDSQRRTYQDYAVDPNLAYIVRRQRTDLEIQMEKMKLEALEDFSPSPLEKFSSDIVGPLNRSRALKGFKSTPIEIVPKKKAKQTLQRPVKTTPAKVYQEFQSSNASVRLILENVEPKIEKTESKLASAENLSYEITSPVTKKSIDPFADGKVLSNIEYQKIVLANKVVS